MIVISGALVLVALVLLVVGLVAETLALVYASIGVTVLSLVLLGIGVMQRRGELLPGDVPGDDLLPGGLHEDASQDAAADRTQSRSDDAATSLLPAAADAPVMTAWEGDRPGGGDVLVVAGRVRYHVEGCRYLADDDAEVLDVLDAREDGFTACGVCRPDDALGVEPVLVRPRSGFDVADLDQDGELDQDEELDQDGELDQDEELAVPDPPGPVEAPTAAVEVAGPADAEPQPGGDVTALPRAEDAEHESYEAGPTSDADVGSRLVTDHRAPQEPSVAPPAPERTTDALADLPADPLDAAAAAAADADGAGPTGDAAAGDDPGTAAESRDAHAKAVPAPPESLAVPKPAARKPATPKPATPKVVGPRPTTTRAASSRATSAQPPTNRAALAKAAASRAALAKSTAPKPAEASSPEASQPDPAGTDRASGQTSSAGLPVRPPSASARAASVRAASARAVAARTVAARAAAARSTGRPDATPGARDIPARDTPARDTGAVPLRVAAPGPATSPRSRASTGAVNPRPTSTGSRKVSAKAPSRPVVPPLHLMAPRPSSAPRPTQGTAPAGQPAVGGSVVVIPDRGRFHRADCRYVRGQAGTQVLSREGAVQQGFQRCGVCQP